MATSSEEECHQNMTNGQASSPPPSTRSSWLTVAVVDRFLKMSSARPCTPPLSNSRNLQSTMSVASDRNRAKRNSAASLDIFCIIFVAMIFIAPTRADRSGDQTCSLTYSLQSRRYVSACTTPTTRSECRRPEQFKGYSKGQAIKWSGPGSFVRRGQQPGVTQSMLIIGRHMARARLLLHTMSRPVSACSRVHCRELIAAEVRRRRESLVLGSPVVPLVCHRACREKNDDDDSGH